MADKRRQHTRDINLQRLARNLRAALQAEGVTATRAAIEAGVRKDAIRDIINGRIRSPRLSTLEPIAKRLRTTVDALLGEEPTGVVDMPTLLVPIISTGNIKKLLAGVSGVELAESWEPVIGEDTEDWVGVRVGDECSPEIPPGATVMVDRNDTSPRTGREYLVMKGDAIGVRHYRDNPPRFEPVNTQFHDTYFLPTDLRIVGRVRRVILHRD